MTNPNNIVRIGTRNGGFASVLEGNNSAQAFTTGLYSGNGVLQNTSPDLNVLVGGSASNPDTLIASTPSGAKVIIDIAGQQAVQITTPVSNSRIASVVAYTNDLSIESTDTTKTGNPSSCGLIVVYGSQSASPSPATDSDIRAAITTDGATGSQSAYCVVANITVANNTTAITNTLINLQRATLNTNNIRNGSIEPEKITFASYSTSEQRVGTWIDGKPIYRRVIAGTVTASANTLVVTNFSSISDSTVDNILSATGYWYKNSGEQVIIGSYWTGNYSAVVKNNTLKLIRLLTQSDASRTDAPYAIILEYTKTTD